jgi:uncharacterized iron-regulated membrane protein
MTLKKSIGKVHLWLGLASGLVVFVIAITGCILAFEVEIKNLTQPYLSITAPANGKLLPPSVLKARAEQQLPGKKATGIVYQGPGKSAGVGFYNPQPEYYYVVYLNPYSGEVLKVWDEDGDFFHFILHGHYYLWLPEKIGQPVVASATLIFLGMLVSGLVLWWPKNKSAAKQRFSIRWNAKWRRVNYDLHNVLGFYMLTIGLVLAFTGLVWGFEWFSQSVYWATGGKGTARYSQPLSDTTLTQGAFPVTEAVDRVWQKLVQENSGPVALNLSFPGTRAESIYASVNHRQGTYYQTDYHFFDQQTLRDITVETPYSGKYADASPAIKLRRMNYDIHVGAIWGLPGKILMFCASLICATLPISGFYIWWGRRKKDRKDGKAIPANIKIHSKRLAVVREKSTIA